MQRTARRDCWTGCLIWVFVLSSVFFTFFTSCGAFAAERSFWNEICGPCPGGCGDDACDCDEALRARNRHDWIFRNDTDHYEDIRNDFGDAIYKTAEDGLLVVNREMNESLGFTYPVPQRGRNNLHWRAQVEIKNIDDGMYAGLGLSNGIIGYMFDVDRFGNSRLRVETEEFVEDVSLFTLHGLNFPFFLTLDYDVRSARLIGAVVCTDREERQVFSVSLPYYGMPAVATIAHAVLWVSTWEYVPVGSASYGDLYLRGE